MKFAATFKTYQQTGPDDYEGVVRALHITPATTVAEIIAWYRMAERMKPDIPFTGPISIIGVDSVPAEGDSVA